MKNNMKNDNYFYVGIDLGTSCSIVSYDDYNSKKTYIYDMTGGYGDASIPMVLQYIQGEDQWLIGRDARNNREQAGTYYIDNLLEIFISQKEIKIEDSVYTPCHLMTIYINKILEGFKLINPLSEIKRLTISVSDDLFFQLEDDLATLTQHLQPVEARAMPSTQGMIEYLAFKQELKEGENILYDYGYRAFRQYCVLKKQEECVVTLDLVDETISGQKVEAVIKNLIQEKYVEEVRKKTLNDEALKDQRLTPQEKAQIDQVFYQYFSRILREYEKKSDVKIYYNFLHPPFYKRLTFNEIHQAMSPFISHFEKKITRNKKGEAILTGNGFKMIWPKRVMTESLFIEGQEAYHLAAKGNCILSATEGLETKKNKVIIETASRESYGVFINQGEELIFDELMAKRDLDHERGVVREYIVEPEGENCYLSLYRRTLKNEFEIEKKILLDLKKSKNQLIRVSLSLKRLEDNSLEAKIHYLPV
jgi:hypothetical protein